MIASILLTVLAALLLVAAVTDLRSRIIANSLNLAIAALAPVFWWATGLAPWPDMAVQFGLGVAVFAIFAALFALGWMGGGDVKLLAALALWLPLAAMLKLIVLMSLLGGVLTLIMLVWHKIRPQPQAIEVPYGVAIAAAGLWVVGERYLNQFA